MTAEYAETDLEVADYQVYDLDPAILDPETRAPLRLRGPRPAELARGGYLACIGAAQTFGRFCERPFPALLGQRLGSGVLNLGRGGAGPSFFTRIGGGLPERVNRARLAVVQVMSGRSASNSLFESRGLGYYRRRADGVGIGCDEAFQELLANHGPADVARIVAETREDWIRAYGELLAAIRVPRILFWFSTRPVAYEESYDNLDALYGTFPQLVTPWMIERLRPHVDAYVECVSSAGLPHRLVSRRTGMAVTLEDPWGGRWTENAYYPSPEMHEAAARALEPACRRLGDLPASRGGSATDAGA